MIRVNGTEEAYSEEMTVMEYVSAKGYRTNRIAVEKNGQCTLPPVPPEKETELQQSPAELPSGAEKLCSGARLHTVRLSA